MAVCMQRAPTMAVRAQRRAVAAPRPVKGLVPVVRASASAPEPKQQEGGMVAKLALPLASAVTAAAVLSCVQLAAPGEALAARSGGRAGASSFAARRAAPRMAAPSRSYSSTTVIAPPVYSYSPFGFGGFGFGGFMPVMPIPFFGGFLQLMFLMLIVSAVFNVVKSAIGSSSGGSKNKSQDWDDL